MIAYKDWCAQKCEWCKAGWFLAGPHHSDHFPIDITGLHPLMDVKACAAGDRDAFESELSTELAAAKERVRELRNICGEAYQLAGAIGAPVAVLDNLSDAANGGPLRHATFLPILDTDCDKLREVESLKERVRELEKENADLEGANLPLYSDRIRNMENKIAEQAEEIAGLKEKLLEAQEHQRLTDQRSANQKAEIVRLANDLAQERKQADLYHEWRQVDRKQLASQAALIEKAREALEDADLSIVPQFERACIAEAIEVLTLLSAEQPKGTMK